MSDQQSQNHSWTLLLTAETHVQINALCILFDSGTTLVYSAALNDNMRHQWNNIVPEGGNRPKQARWSCTKSGAQAALRPNVVIEVRVTSNGHMEPDTPEPKSPMTGLTANGFVQLPTEQHGDH